MGIRLVEERFFTTADRTDTESMVLVNEAFAKRFILGAALAGSVVPAYRASRVDPVKVPRGD